VAYLRDNQTSEALNQMDVTSPSNLRGRGEHEPHRRKNRLGKRKKGVLGEAVENYSTPAVISSLNLDHRSRCPCRSEGKRGPEKKKRESVDKREERGS